MLTFPTLFNTYLNNTLKTRKLKIKGRVIETEWEMKKIGTEKGSLTFIEDKIY